MQVQVIHTAFEDSPRVVAFVECGDLTGMAALEYAYMKTNNINGSWSLEKYVDVNGEMIFNEDFSDNVTVMADHPVNKRTGEKMGIRSTSVGDQMLLGNKKYRVASLGFKEVH